MTLPYEISIHLLKVTKCSIEFAFYSIQDFFFSRTEQKITIDSDFIRGAENPEI